MKTEDMLGDPPMQVQAEDRAEGRVAQYVGAFPEVDRDAIEAGFRLARAHGAQSDALLRLFNRLSVDLTLPRHSVLRFLYLSEPGPKTQNEIKSDLGVTSPTITFLVDGLESSGLAVRTRNPADRREIFVALTERGREVAAAFVPEMPGYFNRMFKGLSPAEKRRLVRLLKKLEANARDAYLD